MPFAAKKFAAEVFNWDAFAAPVPGTAHDEQIYRIEVRNAAGTMLAILDKVYAGSWRQKVNEPDEFTFSYPFNETTKTAHFVFPNQVWLYDTNASQPLQKFFIAGRKKISEAAGTRWDLRCKSLLAQLSREKIDSYAVTTATKIIAILISIFEDDQLNAYPFKVGKIHKDIGDTTTIVSFENKSILSAINELHKAVGGFFYIDPKSKRLNWTVQQGDSKGQQIRLGKNMMSMTVDEDFEQIATRLTAYGEGVTPGTKLPLAGSGYVEANTGTYGTIPDFYSDQSIGDVDLLTKVATEEIARRSVPKKQFDLGVIDLTHAGGDIDYSFEKLRVGSKITVINEDLGEEIETRILTIDRSIDSPLQYGLGYGASMPGTPGQVSIQVSDPDAGDGPTRKDDFIDAVAELFDKLDTQELEDNGVVRTIEQLLGIDDIDKIVTLDGTGVGALGDDSGGTAGDDMVSGGDIATWNPDTGIGTLDDMLSDIGTDSQVGHAYFQITAIGGDSLTCNEYFPETDTTGSSVTVAKPFMLRKTPFDGETITYPNGDAIEYTYDAVNPERKRVSDDGATTKTQYMTPMYYVGEIIRAAKGETGVGSLVFEDQNTAGRHWAG